MDETEKKRYYFIEYLESLRDANDRGALASLRKGLGKAPGSVPAMYPTVYPHLPPNISKRDEENYFIIASLFATHPDAGGRGNMGDVFRQLMEKTQSGSIENRFVAILNTHREELAVHLRHAVSLAKANSVPVDWNQLLGDIKYWDNDNKYTQKQWARSFWQEQHIQTREEEINSKDTETEYST